MHIREAHSVAKIAHELIQTVDDHNHLRDSTILALFTDQEPGPRAKGCKRFGRVKAATTWDTFLFHWGTADPGDELDGMRGLEFRYALIVFETPWGKLNADRQRFVVDELLSHCEEVENEVSGEVSYIVAQHGFGGFQAVLERHGDSVGALDEEEAAVVRIAHQLPLPPERETIEQAPLTEPHVEYLANAVVSTAFGDTDGSTVDPHYGSGARRKRAENAADSAGHTLEPDQRQALEEIAAKGGAERETAEVS